MASKEKKTVWDRNFAEDKEIAERVAAHLVPRMTIVRKNRMMLEESWWRFWNMWAVVKDGYHNYSGRAQLYIPEVRKNVEEQARQMTKSAFPSDEIFDVSPGQTGTRRGALAWKSFQRWAIDNCNLQAKYFVAMRQEALLGTAPIYLPWRKTVRQEFRSRRDKKTKKVLPTKQEVELFNGPDFLVRDLFRWYTFNPKKADLSDGCFEIMAVSPFELKAAFDKGELANYDDIRKGSTDAYLTEEFNRDIMRAESLGIQIMPNQGYAAEYVLKKHRDEEEEINLTYSKAMAFVDMILPEACEEDEDPDQPIPMKIEIYGNSVCGLIQRNPFYHQSPPYVVGKYIQPNADEFYGQGIPWAIQYMQYEMNSKAEQGMDSATLSLNPISVIDPGLAGASSEFTVEPGANWWANPAGVKLLAIPDVTPVAYQAISQLKSLMGDYSDRSPALPPQLMGKSRTATQSEIVFDTMGVDNWLFQLQNERLILEPMLEQWEAITDQNMSDDMLIMILGRRAGDLKRTLLSREDLLGKYAYEWKGASATASKQVLGRQMLDAMKVLTMIPPNAMQGLNFNWGEFFKILWTDVWSLPDADRILGIPEEMVTQDAEAENKMAKMGLEIEVLPMDDDMGHMPVHDKALGEEKDETVKAVLMAHLLVHKKQADAKQQAAQQQQQMMHMQMMLQMQQAQGGGGAPGPGNGRQRRPGSGNRTQMSPNLSAGNMASGNRA